MHAVVSGDGFIADAGDEVGPLFDLTNGCEGSPPAGEHIVTPSAPPPVSRRALTERTGSVLTAPAGTG